MDVTSAIPLDRVLGDFVVGRKIGEGGFGAVYEAEQRGLDRRAVIKLIRSSLASSQSIIDRFTREAKLASRFDHPYAAHIYAFGAEPDGLLWIAMELVRGTPLNEQIARSGPYPIDRFLPLMERLCEVVQAAHDAGIVHRDIKPSNVMVIARSGRLIPKLLDFGIAKDVNDTRSESGTARVPETDPPQDLAQTRPGLDDTVAVKAHVGLTMEGHILGSPIYMAPEQWVDASRVGPWTDQYALAMLAFEALTGNRAFSGTTLSELLDSHANDPMPAMPGLPDAVHSVLARATAKDPGERFPDLNALALAFRAAIVPPTELEECVELPVERLAAWVAAAPRPIAGSLAAVSAARSPVRVGDRVTSSAGVIARWLGALAIACRSQLGKLDATAGLELIRELRRRPLREEEWLELAVELTHPFAGRPEGWPIPEFVGFLEGGEAVGALRGLVRGETPLGVVTGGASVEQQAAVAKVGQLAVALDGLGWLLDYEVAREVATGLEMWVGVTSDASSVRPAYPVPTDATGRIILLDADGTRLLAMSPVVHVAPPAAGEPEQMFLLGGPGLATDSARYVAPPRGFELEVDGVWDWLADNVIDLSAHAALVEDDERSPYPGLSAFTADDHASFIGREREVVELVNRLRTQSTVVVVGPSGVGKSSFLAAGVACALPAGWSARCIRPGSDPFAALSSILGRSEPAPAELAAQLVAMAERLGETVVIVVDQAEELFTVCADDAQRVRFAEALAIASRAPNLRVILGIRDDFLCRIEDLAPWRGMLARSLQILRVPGLEELERIIAVPARRRGFDFDDPTLPRTIASDVAGQPGALPLLAFAAAALWEQRDRHFRRLTRDAYRRIGGVSGALVQYADGVVDRLSAPDRRLVRLAFRRLLTAEGTRALIGREELIVALRDSPAATKVVEHLLAARLIVSRNDDAGELVEIIHEALVTAWPRLVQWRREDDAGARIQRQLATAARLWDGGRPVGLLWRGDALDELRHWRAHAELGVTPVEAAFADASERAWRSGRRRRNGIVVGAFAVLVAGIVLLAYQRANALRSLAANLEERGRLAIVADDAASGLVYLTEARRLGATGPAADLLIARATMSLESQIGVLARQSSAIQVAKFDDRTAVFMDRTSAQSWDLATHVRTGPPISITVESHQVDVAPVGDRLVTIDDHGDLIVTGRDGSPRWRTHVGYPTAFVRTVWPSVGVGGNSTGNVAISYGPTARLWDLDDGSPRGVLVHDDAIMVAAFDPPGRRVATGDAVGVVRIWDAATAAQLAECTGQHDGIAAIQFSADGKLVVTGSNDGNVVVCDAGTGTLVRRFDGTTRVTAIDIAKDGRTVASVGGAGNAQLWDVRTGKLVARLDGHTATLRSVKFSPDGNLLATAGLDATVRVWDVSGTLVAALEGSTATPHAGWEPGGQVLVTAGFDGTIRRWDLDRARRGRTSHPHDGKIAELAITPDGRWWVTAGLDGIAIGTVKGSTPPARLDVGPVKRVRIAPDGRTLLTIETTSRDAFATKGSASLRSMPDGAPIRRLAESGIATAAFTPDGRSIVTGGSDRVIRIWTTEGVELAHFAIAFVAADFAFDPAGRFVIPYSDREDPDVTDLPVIDLGLHKITRHLRGEAPPYMVAVDATGLAVRDGNNVQLWADDHADAILLEGHKGLIWRIVFLPDGRLVSSDDREARVWSRDGRVLSSLATGGATVVAIAAARDGVVFATGGDDGTVRVWDAATYHLLLVLPSHRGAATHLAFTPDGSSLLSAGDDGRVVRWDLRRPRRSLEELDHLVRCRVPYRFDGNALLPRELAHDDPTCLSPGLGK